MQHLLCTVMENQLVAESCYRLVFKYPEEHQAPLPGQFLTIRIGNGISPLLRRPFAFSAYQANSACGEIVYERRGSATRLLASYLPGEELDLIAPLGNAFPPLTAGHHAVLVAGGIGIGPMLFLYHNLKASGQTVSLLVGARNASRLPLSCLPAEAQLCTDDGSAGFRGTVLQYLDQEFNAAVPLPTLFACGPHGMMKAVSAWAALRQASCWVSMEQTMACAVGACMGCVVKVHHEKQYSRVCAWSGL